MKELTLKIFPTMKTMIKTILLAVICCLSNNFLMAQEPQGYYAFDYMKVKPGMHDEYLKLEKAWKKIHQANIKAGKYNFWELTQVAYPSGSNVEYNYVTRINFKGEKQLAAYIENWQMPDLATLLTPEERALVDRTPEIRTLVKSEVWAHEDMAAGKEISKAKVVVFNYFDIPEGATRSDHLRTERELWKPAHEARCQDGKMSGWVLARKILPYGSADAYVNATVDLYADMEQYITNMNPTSYFEKVHAGKDLEKLYAESGAAGDLIQATVRIVVDYSDKPDEETAAKK